MNWGLSLPHLDFRIRLTGAGAAGGADCEGF